MGRVCWESVWYRTLFAYYLAAMDIAASSVDDTTPCSNPESPVERLPLKSLGLRAGLPIQTRRLVEGANKKESQFIGAIEGKGVMVGPLSDEAWHTGLHEGEVCVVRGFTGRYEFSFLSKVLQTFEQPFVYALLAYPKVVDARLVRHSMRVRAHWPTQVANPKVPQALQAANLVDLSVAGAMVKVNTNMGAVGEVLQLHLDAKVESASMHLELEARVCHSQWLRDEECYCVGVAFTQTGTQEKLVLSYLLQNAEVP